MGRISQSSCSSPALFPMRVEAAEISWLDKGLLLIEHLWGDQVPGPYIVLMRFKVAKRRRYVVNEVRLWSCGGNQYGQLGLGHDLGMPRHCLIQLA